MSLVRRPVSVTALGLVMGFRPPPRGIFPTSPAAAFEFVTTLLRDVDDEGNTMEPLITPEQARALLDTPIQRESILDTLRTLNQSTLPAGPREPDGLTAIALQIQNAGARPHAATVELMDENDPDGIVVFRDKSGDEVMFLNRADYEALK